uniref:Uncharacterized protein n=1 Tax=Klebsiella oxytoca TaxID=571 RepID=A0A1Z3ML80_KLEOX|nr:hypothetical protein [Klebsiella oxytoca]
MLQRKKRWPDRLYQKNKQIYPQLPDIRRQVEEFDGTELTKFC